MQDAAAADQAAADAVVEKIEAIGTVTLDSQAAIEAARTAYDALTESQKALVANYETLTAAEASLKVLQDAAAADQAAADAVVEKIEAIGTVTLDSQAAIEAARAAYDALTESQKALVANYETLTAAEQAYAALGSGAPETGDPTNVMLFRVMMIVSFMGAVVLLLNSKKNCKN